MLRFKLLVRSKPNEVLAVGALEFLREPLVDALCMEDMAARKRLDLGPCLDDIEANRASDLPLYFLLLATLLLGVTRLDSLRWLLG